MSILIEIIKIIIGAGVFGIILTIYAIINGKNTRKQILKQIELTRELIISHDKATQELIAAIEQRAEERHTEIIQKFDKITPP